MSGFSNLIGGGSSIGKLISDSRDSGNLFRDASWSQVGTNKELTDFLHQSLDPNGDKYGGNTDSMKEDLLNTTTTRGSSALASVWDAIGASSEGQHKKQFENLVGRLYEDAPNRLASGNANDTYQALKSGVVGAVVYDLPLNMLFGAGVLGKVLNGGRTALSTAGKSILGREAAANAGIESGTMAAREAFESSAKSVVSDTMKAGAMQSAKLEAVGGAAGGFIGDIAQQNANVDRGLQSEISATNSIANTVGGAVLGGAFGAVGGAVEGRSLGKKLAGDLPAEITKGRQALAEAGEANSNLLSAPTQNADGDFVTFADAYRDLKSNLSNASDDIDQFANRLTKGDVESRYTPEQISTLRSSLDELAGGDNLAESYQQLAVGLKQKADQTGDPEALKQSFEAAATARRYENFVQSINKAEDLGLKGETAGDEMIDKLVAMVTPFSRDVATAFGKVVDDATATSGKKKASSATSSNAQPTSLATENVAPNAALSQNAGGATTVTTADGTTVTTGSAAPAKAAANTTTQAASANASMEDIKATALKLTDEYQSLAGRIEATGATADTDPLARALNTAVNPLARDVESLKETLAYSKDNNRPDIGDMAELVIKDRLAKLDASIAQPVKTTTLPPDSPKYQSANNALKAARDAEVAEAEALRALLPPEVTPVPATASAAQAAPAATSAPAQVTPVDAAPTPPEIEALASNFSPLEKRQVTQLNDALAKAGMTLDDAVAKMSTSGQTAVIADVVSKAKAAGHTDVTTELVATNMTAVTGAIQRERSKVASAATTPTPKTPVEARVDSVMSSLEKEAADGSGATYVAAKTAMAIQHKSASDALDGALEAIAKLDAGADGAAKGAAAKAHIDKLMTEKPELQSMLSLIDPAKMTSANAVAKAKVKLQNAAQNAISMTYAKIVGDVLPDPLNVGNFETVISSMLRGVPSEDVARIVSDYRSMVYNALVDRIDAVGIDSVVKDKKLGPAWQRLIAGEGGVQKFGGKGQKFEIAALIQHQAEMTLAAYGGAPITSKQITEVGAIVRDFMKSIEAAGVPTDSKFMADAVAARVDSATKFVLSGQFRIDNAGDFEKMAKMAELRERDKGRGSWFTRSTENWKNPFHRSTLENPVLHRMYGDDGIDTDMIVSGRVAGTNRPQSVLSDGISEYLGTLWANPKRLYSANAAALRSIYGAAVENASWSLGSMVIGGKKVSGTMKALKGLQAETIVRRMEQLRFENIVDAVKRSRLEDGDVGYLSKDAFEQRISDIGSRGRAVTDDDKYIANLYADSRSRIESNLAIARAEMTEVLSDAANMGESAAEQISNITNRINKFLVKNDADLLRAMEGTKTKAEASVEGRSKTRKSGGVEGTEAGAAETKTTRERDQDDQRKSGGGNLTVNADGSVAYGKRDSDPITVKIKGVTYEFVPKDAIALSTDGSVNLFGEKIGTWVTSEKSVREVSVLIDGMGEKSIQDITSLAKQKQLVKAFQSKFDSNTGKMTEGSKAAASLPEGSQIDRSFSRTEEVAVAQRELLQPGAITPTIGAQRIDSVEVPADRVLAFKRRSDSRIIKPSADQRAMAISEFAAKFKIAEDDIEMGSIPAGRMSAAGKLNGLSAQKHMLNEFTPLGRDTGAVKSEIVQKLAEKKEHAPEMLAAQRGTISITKAEKIQVGENRSLADVVNEFGMNATALRWDRIGSLNELDAIISTMEKQAELIESVAPYGVKLNNSSRRTAFANIERHMAQFTPEERQASLDLFRRLDAERGGLPYVYADENNSFGLGTGTDAGSSRVYLGRSADPTTPKHIAVAHEVGHWAFVNMLSPSEKIQFIKSLRKYYGEDGKLDMESVLNSMGNAKAIERATGKRLADLRDNTNELFAWHFTNWYADKAIGKAGESAENSLWQRVVTMGKSLLSHFLGQKVDKDLVPLFERIMPAAISDTKFNYNTLRDLSTGEIVDPRNVRKDATQVNSITGLMESIDKLRGRIGQNLFIPGSAGDVGLSEELRSASKYMFGLLMGKSSQEPVTGLRAKLNASRNDGDWSRDSKGKVIKDENGKGVRESQRIPGAVDPRELFSRNSTGKLMQAVNDMTPEGMGDNLAFEAAAGAEEFNVILKASSIGDNPEVQVTYNQTMASELKKNLDAGMKEADAYDAADMAALKEAATYAKKEFGIDIDSSLFDGDGSRVKLGTDQQREALGDVARKLHDLMSDSLDHLQSKMESQFGYTVDRSSRSLPPLAETPQTAAATKEAEKTMAKVGRKQKPKAGPATAASEKATKLEESERSIDGNQSGVPAGAPDLVKSLIARVPHRDAAQSDIIGTLMSRVLKHVLGEDAYDNPTNADIARLIGVDLEKGVKPKAMASSTTGAFDELRKAMRVASEDLTNPDRNPLGAFDTVVDILARNKIDALNEEFMADAVDAVTGKAQKFNASSVSELVKGLARGKQPASEKGREMAGALYEIMADATDILAGLGATARAKRELGNEVVESAGKTVSVRYSNGTYHPSFVSSATQSRLEALPTKIANALLESVGIRKTERLADDLSSNIAYVKANASGKAGREIYTTTEAAAKATAKSETLERIDSEIAKAITSGDSNQAQKLMDLREANMAASGQSDGLIPVILNMATVASPANITHAQVAAVESLFAKAVSGTGLSDALKGIDSPVAKFNYMKTNAGSQKAFDDLLKAAGFTGIKEGDTARLFSTTSAKKLDEEILRLSAMKRNATEPDAPLVGEIFLNMAFEEAGKPDPLAVEQRALQTGADAPTAGIMSELFKKTRSVMGLTPAKEEIVKKFSGFQLRTNASRIMKAGGEWLSNAIAPVEGTGFHESLFTRMSSTLTPLSEKLDSLAGVGSWYKKVGSEIRRNLDMRGHRIPQTDAEDAIVMAMRSGDLNGLSLEHRQFKVELDGHFRKLLEMQRKAGIPVGDISGGGSYLPQRFNQDWIRANRDDSIDRLANWFTKEGKEAGAAKISATKVINDAIFREDLQGILDSSNNVYTQAFGDKLHSRKLNITGDAWEAMAPMFDNNLRSLMVSYTEAAYKRVEYANRFGVRGHGVSTYVDIADRGASAAIDALMSSATGMKYHVGNKADADINFAGGFPQAETADKLFSPMASDPQKAAELVAMVTTLLSKDKGVPSRNGIVDTIVAKFEREGGQGVDHFRKRAESIVNGLADFGDAGGGVASHERDFMMKMVGTLEGRPAYTINANQGLRQAAGAVKAFNAVTLLSGAVLSSLADPALSLIRSGSMEAWAKGTVQAAKLASADPAMREAMARVGVGMESILNENITHVHGGISGRVSNAFFQASMLTPWTNANRQVAALVGYESIKANQTIVQREMFNGNVDTHAYRKSMRYLRQLGLGYLSEGDKLNDFASAVNADMKIAEAIHKFTNESVFQPNRNDVPLWAQDPIAGLFWQFKSYPMMMGRMVKRSVYEAFATEKGHVFDGGESGKYAGDPASLMYLLTIGAAAGAGSLYVKDNLLGKNQDAEDGEWRSFKHRTASKMVQEFGFKDYEMENGTMDLIAGTYVSGLFNIGALGFLGDLMYQTAKSVDDGSFGRERIMSQIAGPALGTFSDSIQIISGAQDALKNGIGEGSAEQRNAVRKVVKRIPFVGGQDPWAEAIINDVAGNSTTKPTDPQAFWQ